MMNTRSLPRFTALLSLLCLLLSAPALQASPQGPAHAFTPFMACDGGIDVFQNTAGSSLVGTFSVPRNAGGSPAVHPSVDLSGIQEISGDWQQGYVLDTEFYGKIQLSPAGQGEYKGEFKKMVCHPLEAGGLSCGYETQPLSCRLIPVAPSGVSGGN